MKIIKPSVELWQQDYSVDGIWKHIAKCTRVCYQSEPRKNGETDKEFVHRVIFRNINAEHLNGRIMQLKLHLSTLEHATVYLAIPNKSQLKMDINSLNKDPHSRVKYDLENEHYYVETNMRVLVEKGFTYMLNYITEPEYEDRFTFSITTDIGIARELDRHRSHSISEESTRFVNYSKDKYGHELTFIEPAWLQGDYSNELFKLSCKAAEDYYMKLIDAGWTAQKAREVLPLCTKVQTVHTAYLSDWEEFLKLRSDAISGSVHPNMKLVADKIRELLNNSKERN